MVFHVSGNFPESFWKLSGNFGKITTLAATLHPPPDGLVVKLLGFTNVQYQLKHFRTFRETFFHASLA
jgi:hypothetical protein